MPSSTFNKPNAQISLSPSPWRSRLITTMCALLCGYAPSALNAQDDIAVQVFDEGVSYVNNGMGTYANWLHYMTSTNGAWGTFSRGTYAGVNWRLNSEPIVNTNYAHIRVPVFVEDGPMAELSTLGDVIRVRGIPGDYWFQWARGSETSYPALARPVMHRGCGAIGTYNGAIRAWAVIVSTSGPALYEYTLNGSMFSGERKLVDLQGNHRGLAYSQGYLWLHKQGSGVIQQLNPANGGVVATFPLTNYTPMQSPPQLTGMCFLRRNCTWSTTPATCPEL